jgi:hypothetical protein
MKVIELEVTSEEMIGTEPRKLKIYRPADGILHVRSSGGKITQLAGPVAMVSFDQEKAVDLRERMRAHL